MNKTIIVILVVIAMVFIAGSNIARASLVDVVNKRTDSSDAVLLNEIDARLYADFHKIEQPVDVSISANSIKYFSEGRYINIYNDGNYIEMDIQYEDGSIWKGDFRGKIEVTEVEVININGQMKVDLESTNAKVYAVTYKMFEDFNKKRTTLNRDFTRYLTLTEVR